MQVAMALGLLVIIIIIVLSLLGSLIGGIALIIITAKRSKKRKAEGLGRDAMQVFMTVLCVVLLAAPVGIGGKLLVDKAYLAISRTQYKSFTDKWKNEFIFSENMVLDDCFRPMLEMAENGDKEGLRRSFPANMQGEKLDRQIEEFIAAYPKGLAMSDKMEYRYNSSSGSGDREELTGSGTVELDGKTYYIELAAVYQDKNKDNVGMKRFVIESEEVYEKNETRKRSGYENKMLYCDLQTDTDVDVVIIEGQTFVRKTNAVMRYDDIIKAMKECEKISEFEECIGEPNVEYIHDPDSPFSTEWYYEIEPEGDKKRYLHIFAYSDGMIDKELTYICGRDDDYIRIWFDKDGNVKQK